MKGLIEVVLVVAVAVGSTIIVISTMTPFLEEGKSSQAFIDAKNTLTEIDSSMQQIMVEAVGSRRQLDVDIKDGRLIVTGDEERIKIRLEDFKLLTPGTVVQEGNIQIRAGGKVDAVEEDVNRDGNTDLVLKNSALMFAVRKIGNATNWTSINTADVITQINNTVSGRGVRPSSGIYVNDRQASSYGTGYTALTNKGKNIESGSILVFVDSAAGIKYEALFTLAAGADFVQLEIKNVEGA